MTQASTMDTQKQLRMGRIRRSVDGAVRHLVLIGLSVVWLVPILWLLVTSLSTYAGINFRTFFPDHYTFQNYIDILFHSDSVAQFPRWFMNTLVVGDAVADLLQLQQIQHFPLSFHYSFSGIWIPVFLLYFFLLRL